MRFIMLGVVAGALSLEGRAVVAQERPRVTVEQVGENRLGPTLATALRKTTAGWEPNAPHRVRLVTAPSPCQEGIVVSMVLLRASTFVTSAVLVVHPADVESVAQSLAGNLARDLK